MAIKEYKIERRRSGYIVAIHGFLLGTVLMIPSVFLAISYPFAGIIVMIIVVKVYYIKVIDFLFVKKIYQDNQCFYVKMFLLKLKLNRKTILGTRGSFLVIENVTVLSSSFTRFYGLVLVRNSSNFLNRVLKNKVLLYVEESKLDIEAIALKISKEFEIDYIGRYV